MAPKAKSNKRKEPAASDSESDVPPELQPDPNEQAKRQFLGVVSEPVPESKHSSGGSTTATVEGVVLRYAKILVTGAKGPVPKLQITVAATKFVLNGVKDVVSPGIDGVAFGLPTRHTEPSPDELARNAKAKGASVLDVIDEYSRANYLGTLTVSFYVDGAGGKDKSGLGPEACVPGTRVHVYGVSCVLGRNGTSLFTNAKDMQPVSSSLVQPGEVAKNIIEAAVCPSAQQGASLLLSMAMGGFFGVEHSEPALQQQADACRAKWAHFIEGTAAKLDAIALAIGKDESLAQAAKMLGANAERIRGLSADAVAAGTPLFAFDLQKDCLTPFSAPIVQRGVQPAAELSVGAGQMSLDLFDPAKRDRLPPAFVEGKLANVTSKGNLTQLDFRLFFVFDKTAAILALQDGKSPVLTSQISAASVKFSKKSLGPELFGTNVSAKIDMCSKEILPCADMALHAAVFPRGADDLQLDGHFASLSGIDLVSGLLKAGIRISKSFVDHNMLGGKGVHIFKPLEDAEQVETAEKSLGPPSLAKQTYHALSESSFDFDTLVAPGGASVEFVAVAEGCRAAVAGKPSIANNVDDGEAFLTELAEQAGGDLRKFMKERALVYAVAV